MTRDRLVWFLRKRPAGGSRVTLTHEQGGLPATVLGEWSADELQGDGDPGGNVADTILEACQDYADTEGGEQRFLVRWIGSHDRPLSSQSHKARAQQVDAPPPSAIDKDAIIRELLGHIAAQQKQLNAALPTITSNLERVLNMLATQLAAVTTQLQAERERPRDAAPAELSPEQREESLQRSRALAAFTTKLPEVLELGIAAVAQHVLKEAPPTGGVQ